MSLLVLLVPMAILLAAIFLAGYIWAVSQGHFDDLVTPAHRMLSLENEHEEIQVNNMRKDEHHV